MGNINTSEYGAWEEGFKDGFDMSIRLLQIAKKFEDTGFSPEEILERELEKILK